MMNAVTLLCEAVRNGRKYVFDTGSFEVGGDDYDVRLYVYSSRPRSLSTEPKNIPVSA